MPADPSTYIRDVLEHIRAPLVLREFAREYAEAKRSGDRKAAAAALRKAERVYRRRLKNS